VLCQRTLLSNIVVAGHRSADVVSGAKVGAFANDGRRLRKAVREIL
jgi:hypothetical protein